MKYMCLEIVAKLGRAGRRRRLKGKRGRGTLADEKPPILGMVHRKGAVVIAVLPNGQRVTIAPLIQQTIQAGSRLYKALLASRLAILVAP